MKSSGQVLLWRSGETRPGYRSRQMTGNRPFDIVASAFHLADAEELSVRGRPHHADKVQHVNRAGAEVRSHAAASFGEQRGEKSQSPRMDMPH